ncbi:type I secretion system permease/ATPase [Jannaschia marina]|uniref:type I secretion system permease/ATPase n=1 Tax=Jannaschia marina TaxID=2741674 RepID=UPI0015CDF70A|nr:type I secretion system permease/ATPase [Jannaschia marina]
MPDRSSPVRHAWKSLRRGFLGVALFSLVLNLLMLAAPLYMLQVYDRVLTSQNLDTLIALSVLLGGVFVVTALLDLVRMRILARLGARFEFRIGTPILRAAMRRRVLSRARSGEALTADINGFRDFISGTTPTAFFDAPWIPIYLFILYALHPYLGALGLVGALTLTILALVNNARAHGPTMAASEARGRADALFGTAERNAELAQAMGMRAALARRWATLQVAGHRHRTQAGDRVTSFLVLSKSLRMALQSGMLGLGAALTILGQSTAGVMIASTIILARALAPIDQLIGQWRGFLAARGSYARIDALTRDHPEYARRLNLPNPFRTLDVAIAQAGPPEARNATLTGLSFNLEAGDTVAVIGPSGAGKSTLARMLAGIWMPQKGDVRLDGSPTAIWNPEILGRHVGYLPQDVELFDGTIRENIARFATEIDDAQVLSAAQEADVHDLITALPDGYETQLGQGFHLSGGQRQRIALARALYGNPFLLVLDEPNSDLDTTGETALRRAILAAKARGAITIVMTHRPSTLQAVSKVLILKGGRQAAFGDRDEVLRATRRNVIQTSGAARPVTATPTPRTAGALT